MLEHNSPTPARWHLRELFGYADDIIAWDSLGTGDPPVVLLHGFPGSSYTWRTLALELAKSRRVYVVDLLGFGQSSKGGHQDVSHPAQARLVAALLKFWKLEHPDIVAHDAGAAYALGALLFEGARARRLVLVDAATLNPCISSNSIHVRRYIDAYQTLPSELHATIMRAHIPTTMRSPMSEETFRGYFGPWSDSAGQAAYYRFLDQFDESYLESIEGDLSRVECPTRIVWGAEDTWIPVEVAGRLKSLIPGSDLVVIEDAGHYIADDAPARLEEAIRDFISL